MNIESANGGETNEADDVGAEARTVFVRNLPYTLNDSQLQEVFSEIGPVRRSFTVKQKGAEQHRGFGYVQFAVVGDAIRAVKEKDGTVLEGRKVMVKLAKRRPSFEQRRTKRQPDKQSIKDGCEGSDTSSPEKKAPKKLSNDLAHVEKQHEPIQAMSNTRGEAAQEKHRSEHGSKAIKETSNSLSARSTQELKSPVDVKQHEASKPNLITNGDAAHGRNKRKRKDDTPEPGTKNKKKKKEVLDSCKTNQVAEGQKSSEKQRVARTVILGGLVSPEMREAVIERAKNVGSVESIQSSLSRQELEGRGLDKDGCKMGAAAVVFKSVKAASQAVAELHQKSVGDGTVWARQLGGEGAKPKKWRIIIRNLPFNITEEKIRELFSSSGFVWEARVPLKDDGQARGFAFASFTSKANAEKAIHDMNGTKVQKRPIAVDWAVGKKAYQSSTTVHSDDDDKEKLPSDIEDDETASEDEEEVFAKQQSSFFDGFEDERVESELSELPASFDESDLAKRVLNKVVSASFAPTPEIVESKQTEGDENGCLIPAEESQPERKVADQSTYSTSQGDLNKTIFIKNLPYDVDNATLKRLFLAFGKVKSIYLVQHPKTKRPKGTGFLEFVNAESAEAAFAAASCSTDKEKFVTGISLGGRNLEILKALEKKSVEALEKEKSEQNYVDRRNLYLLKEGKIEEGSPAAIGVSEQDMQKRRQLEQVKAIKLKSPNFHVSKTRLAIYNVPKFLKEVELRKLFIEAVKSRATKQQPVIKQVKILRDEAKGEKLRGVAFVEFTEHQHALVALRVLNNNPESFGPDRRPIVEFAIENLQTLRKRQERQVAAGKKGMSDSEVNAQIKKPKTGEKELTLRQMSDSEGNAQLKNPKTGEKELTLRQMSDSEGNAQLKNPKRGAKKLKLRQMNDIDKSHHLEREEGGLNAREHGGPLAKAAKARSKKKPKVNAGHKTDSSLKRKWEDTIANEADENTTKMQRVPAFKMQKVSKGNAKRGDSEELKSVPLPGSIDTRLKDGANGSRKKMNRAEFAPKAHDLGSHSQQKNPKASKKKKGLKFEVEDKLDKLVAVYREKYFSDKQRRTSTGNAASNDFKRWFE